MQVSLVLCEQQLMRKWKLVQLYQHVEDHVEYHVEQYHAYLGNAQNKDDHNIDDCSEDDHNRMQNYRK